ncbi:MAG: TatD family deoxyribonuclease [Actinobacteria bacterium]|nr:TatD family deoxyribonuclease [Actinomycetota bacterium]
MADRHNRDIDGKPAPLPEPLPITCGDSHAHLEIVTNTEPDHPEIARVIAEAAAVGIDRIVQVGYSAEQSDWCVRLADRFPNVVAAVALHPNEAPVVDNLESDLARIAELAKHPRVRAIGETGLDFFRTSPDLQDRQRYSFKRHIQLAKELHKTVVIHDRDAHQAVLDTLDEVGAPARTVFHCFSGDAQMASECVAKGYILSFAGTVTFKNAPQLREALKLVPLDQLLVETDSPFLAPMPHRGALNTPAQIPNILRFMAAERGDDLVEMVGAIGKNLDRIFGPF